MGPDELYKSERVCGVSFPNPPLSPTLNGSSPSATRLPTPNPKSGIDDVRLYTRHTIICKIY